MAPIPWGKFPTLAEHQLARRWLQFMANIGRASNTIDAYGRAVEDHLRFCAVEGTDPVLAGADTVAAWIGDMLDRPRQRSAKAPLHPETGLANATVQQRLVAVWSFYEYLVEDGLRERIRYAGDSRAAVAVVRGRGSCGASSRHFGSPTTTSGSGSLLRAPRSRYATGSWSRSPMTVPCAARSWSNSMSGTSSTRTA
ncbi:MULTISPECIES: hypothetical protein [Streptomyces]|uniref:hypothetical protein n=1 Tax=Streptomyces TaxID=1883 RepID=UPI001F07EF0B|nr:MULTISPECIES: hypothetical protein [unclassified Streptomyces]